MSQLRQQIRGDCSKQGFARKGTQRFLQGRGLGSKDMLIPFQGKPFQGKRVLVTDPVVGKRSQRQRSGASLSWINYM